MTEVKDKSTVKLRPGFSMREMGLASIAYRILPSMRMNSSTNSLQ